MVQVIGSSGVVLDVDEMLAISLEAGGHVRRLGGDEETGADAAPDVEDNRTPGEKAAATRAANKAAREAAAEAESANTGTGSEE